MRHPAGFRNILCRCHAELQLNPAGSGQYPFFAQYCTMDTGSVVGGGVFSLSEEGLDNLGSLQTRIVLV